MATFPRIYSHCSFPRVLRALETVSQLWGWGDSGEVVTGLGIFGLMFEARRR